jgi:hypothetical protein
MQVGEKPGNGDFSGHVRPSAPDGSDLIPCV